MSLKNKNLPIFRKKISSGSNFFLDTPKISETEIFLIPLLQVLIVTGGFLKHRPKYGVFEEKIALFTLLFSQILLYDNGTSTICRKIAAL